MGRQPPRLGVHVLRQVRCLTREVAYHVQRGGEDVCSGPQPQHDNGGVRTVRAALDPCTIAGSTPLWTPAHRIHDGPFVAGPVPRADASRHAPIPAERGLGVRRITEDGRSSNGAIPQERPLDSCWCLALCDDLGEERER